MSAIDTRVSAASKRQLRAVKRYFDSVPRWPFVLLVLAGAGLVIGTSSEAADQLEAAGFSTDATDLVVAASIISAALALLRLVPLLRRPTGAQMDRWLDRDLERVARRAVEKCGIEDIERVAESVILTGPDIVPPEVAEFSFRRTRRDITRFTPVGVAVLNFAEHEIFGYQCVFDRFTGNAVNETTHEFFYQDIVSVSTETETLTLEKRDLTRRARRLLRRQIRGNKLQIPGTEVFTLSTSGTATFQITIGMVLERLHQLVMGKGGRVDVDEADRAIKGMRKMLREKKTPQPSTESLLE